MDIDWEAPYDNGSPIIGYIISIRQSDNVTYSIEATSCDGSSPSIVDATICSVPISTLRAGAFQLPWGSSIWAKVIAINLYGESVESVEGNGAIILTIPDSPVSLTEDYPQRVATTLAITWVEGAHDGGSPVIDYRVTYVTGGVITVVENIEALTYTATGLQNAVNYVFYV